jgi:hypothetical protein
MKIGVELLQLVCHIHGQGGDLLKLLTGECLLSCAIK